MSDRRYKLHYFDAQGRAEVIRLLFAAANVDFDDIRFSREEWPALKSTFPGGRVPYLEAPDGQVLTQSMAIARYLACKFELYSNSPGVVYLEERAISMITDIWDEIVKINLDILGLQKLLDRESVDKRAESLLRELWLYLEEGGRTFFAGEVVTLPDLYYIATVHFYALAYFPDIIQQMPRFHKLVESVRKANEGVAKWLDTRTTALLPK